MRKFAWPLGVATLCFATGLLAAVPPPAPPTTAPPADAAKPAENASVLAAAKQAGVLRVAMEPDFPPIYWVNEQGEYEGFDYKLAELMAKELGIPKIEMVDDDYDKLPELIRTGKADIIMGGYVPDDSIEGLEWSNSYLDFGLCLIVPKGSPIKTIKQLRGKKIGAYKDPAAIKWIETNIPERKALETYIGVGWLHHVDNRDVDAAIYDYPFAVEEVKAFDRLQITAFNLNESLYAAGFKAGNDDLKTALNQAISTIQASDQYAALIKQYLPFQISREVPEGSDTYTVQPGDILSRIASKELGDSNAWKTIWDLNKHRIPNPNLLEAGDVLIMPKPKVTP